MTTIVSKSKKKLREQITELGVPNGVAGRNILQAETKAQAFELIGSGRKNIVHNGAMAVSQEYQTASHNIDGWSVMGVDRFRGSVRPSTGVFSAEQNIITGSHPAGFSRSLLLTQQSVTADAANDYYNLMTKIEGNDVAHLGLGTEHAKTVTVSFWVKSSITGRYAFGMQNEAGGSARQSYVTDYNIDAPGAWEYKTFVIPLSQTGTWYDDYRAGIQLNWNFGRGTAYETTNLNLWQTNVNALSHSGTVDWIGNSGATWEITGVQMEIGEAATPFEHRPYGEELRLCQRYFCSGFPEGTTIENGTSGNGTNDGINGWVAFTNSACRSPYIYYPVVMRTTPSISLYSVGSVGTGKWAIFNGSSWQDVVSSSIDSNSKHFNVRENNSSFTMGVGKAYLLKGQWTASAEM